MKRILELLFILGVFAVPAFAPASTTVGIFAILDEVSLEPSDAEPVRIRLSGMFIVPRPLSSGQHVPPQRGYLYFSLNDAQAEQSRRDWAALKAAAGTGQVVGFAEYWVELSRADVAANRPASARGTTNVSLVVNVRTQGPPETSSEYPAPNRNGVVTAFDSDFDLCPRFGRPSPAIVAELQSAHDPNLAREALVLPACEGVGRVIR